MTITLNEQESAEYLEYLASKQSTTQFTPVEESFEGECLLTDSDRQSLTSKSLVELAEAYEAEQPQQQQHQQPFYQSAPPTRTKTSKYKFTDNDIAIIKSAAASNSMAERNFDVIHGKLGNSSAVWPEASSPSIRATKNMIADLGFTLTGRRPNCYINNKG